MLLMSKTTHDMKLENFDDLFTGNPIEIEKNLSQLLPSAQALENKSIYLQILSQIALAQAMQKRFDEAHKTLDTADENLTPEYHLAHVRILLERGRVFHQSDNNVKTSPFFQKSYELSVKHSFDFHTINAAHMIAIVTENVDEKIEWNKKAIGLAKQTDDNRGRAWLGALYNNLAQNYIEAMQFNEALSTFKLCRESAEEKNESIIIRGAKWGIGRSLRSLNRLDEALRIQHQLLKEYDEVVMKNELPIELLIVGRGLVYEELAEIHLAYAKKFSECAYHDLSKDPWFIKLEPKRLEKIKQQM
jgi:tetratricopeptide (TPR) repeat protein